MKINKITNKRNVIRNVGNRFKAKLYIIVMKRNRTKRNRIRT